MSYANHNTVVMEHHQREIDQLRRRAWNQYVGKDLPMPARHRREVRRLAPKTARMEIYSLLKYTLHCFDNWQI